MDTSDYLMDVKLTDPLFCAEPELSDVPVLFELVRIVIASHSKIHLQVFC